MAKRSKGGSFLLLVGDIAVFTVSLWLTLTLRYFRLPTNVDFINHLTPFSLLFVVWVLVFFIAGLYDRYTLLIRSKLAQRVITAHVFNLVIASVFFYAVPYYGITPKTTLFLYLLVSTICIGFWRFMVYPSMAEQSALNIVALGSSKEVEILKKDLDQSHGLYFNITRIMKADDFDLRGETSVENQRVERAVAKIEAALKQDRADTVAVDMSDPMTRSLFTALYKLIFDDIHFIEIQDLYEYVTDKVPVNLIDESWFLEHASVAPNFIYDALKRLMDIIIALPISLVAFILCPFVWIAIRLDDKGPLFIYQERVGRKGRIIKIAKFRSMTVSDEGKWVKEGDTRITRVGKFIRKSRIDEFPQGWNILKGDLSFIGPRPELPKLVELYKKEIPHYNIRHLIKPGLSGWAQIHHEKPPHSIEETIEKIAFDLYYIKHRSFWLDLKIALQTVKTLISRVGV